MSPKSVSSAPAKTRAKSKTAKVAAAEPESAAPAVAAKPAPPAVALADQDEVMRALGAAREIFERVADKWSLLVVARLAQSPVLRFAELKEGIEGVGQKQLAQVLRQLERDGLVTRKIVPMVPPRVEYRLTGLGLGLLAIVTQLCGLVRNEIGAIEAARRAFDERGTGED